MSYPVYPIFRQSRHLWLDQIPSHWDSVNIRLIAKRYSGGTPDKSNSLYWTDGTIPWLNSGEVNQGVITEPTTYITEDALAESSAKWIPPNSIIIALAGQGKTKGMAAITTFKTTCNQSMATVIFETDYPKFMYWWLVSQYKNIRGMASDDARDGLNLEMIATIPCPRPSAGEQQQIAAFLDWKTEQIDALIAKKKTLLEKLKEKRLAVITQAVTKGLNPAAALRDSGIPWLGQVPKHWEVVPLGFLMTMSGGMTPSMANSEYWEGEIPWVTPKDMKQPRIADSIDHVTEKALVETSISLIPVHAVLIVVRGMILAHSFPTAITEAPVTINQDMKALRCGDKLEVKFLFWCLTGFAKVLSSLAQESAHGTRKVETETLKKLPFPVPPLAEQSAIKRHLEDRMSQLDQLAEATEKTIDRLTEYRTALITAATTGKIDVRHVKVPVRA